MQKFKRDQEKENNGETKDDKDTIALAFNGSVAIISDDCCVNLICQNTIGVVDLATSFHVTSR